MEYITRELERKFIKMNGFFKAEPMLRLITL